MSVTAAAASAQDFKKVEGPKEVKKVDNDNKNKFDNDNKNRFDNDNKNRFDDHREKKHYHPGHWEKHREGHKEYRNNHWVVVYKIVTVYKTAYWSYN
jgi:hypothetical protein